MRLEKACYEDKLFCRNYNYKNYEVNVHTIYYNKIGLQSLLKHAPLK